MIVEFYASIRKIVSNGKVWIKTFLRMANQTCLLYCIMHQRWNASELFALIHLQTINKITIEIITAIMIGLNNNLLHNYSIVDFKVIRTIDFRCNIVICLSILLFVWLLMFAKKARKSFTLITTMTVWYCYHCH